MLRKSLITSALVLTLSLSAFGARFSDTYDALETTVQGLQDALPPEVDKTQKKAAKAYKSTLKKLSKDTDSLKKEIKLGKGIAGKLSKLRDAAVDAALSGAADDATDDVIAALQDAQSKLDAAAAKVKPSKVQKQIDAGYDALESAATQAKIAKRFALIGKAESRARKADKLAGKVGGGGGGGGGSCDGTPIGAGDTVTITKDAASFAVGKYDARLFSDEFRSQTLIDFLDCDGKQVLSLTLPQPLTVGSYFGGSIQPESFASFFFGPLEGFGKVSFNGTVTVTSVAPRIQLTFQASFPGEVGEPFSGDFVGTIDIPAIE